MFQAGPFLTLDHALTNLRFLHIMLYPLETFGISKNNESK